MLNGKLVSGEALVTRPSIHRASLMTLGPNVLDRNTVSDAELLSTPMSGCLTGPHPVGSYSNENILFQSFFMLITVQLFFFASS